MPSASGSPCGIRSPRSSSPRPCRASRGRRGWLPAASQRRSKRLRAEPGEGDIAIGGATLAAEAAALGLIDEYRLMVLPVLVGGGMPFFSRDERQVDLELVEARTVGSQAAYLRYRVAGRPPPDGDAASGAITGRSAPSR